LTVLHENLRVSRNLQGTAGKKARLFETETGRAAAVAHRHIHLTLNISRALAFHTSAQQQINTLISTSLVVHLKDFHGYTEYRVVFPTKKYINQHRARQMMAAALKMAFEFPQGSPEITGTQFGGLLSLQLLATMQQWLTEPYP
jgi:hypothetical protein